MTIILISIILLVFSHSYIHILTIMNDTLFGAFCRDHGHEKMMFQICHANIYVSEWWVYLFEFYLSYVRQSTFQISTSVYIHTWTLYQIGIAETYWIWCFYLSGLQSMCKKLFINVKAFFIMALFWIFGYVFGRIFFFNLALFLTWVYSWCPSCFSQIGSLKREIMAFSYHGLYRNW